MSSSKSRHHRHHERSARSSRRPDDAGWSDPIFHEEHQRYYKTRHRRGEEPEFEWLTAQSDSTPRTDPVAALAEDVASLNVNEGAEYGAQHYDSHIPPEDDTLSGHYGIQPSIPEASEVAGEGDYHDDLYTTSSRSRHHRDTRRARQPETELDDYDPDFNAEDPDAAPPIPSCEPKGKGKLHSHAHDDTQYQEESYEGRHSVDSAPQDYYHDDARGDYQHDPVDDGRNEDYTYGEQIEGEAGSAFGTAELQSAHAAYYGYGDEASHAMASTYAEPSAYQEQEEYHQFDQDAYASAHGDEYGEHIPRSSQQSMRNYVTGTPGDVEDIDPRYKVEHSRKFKPGSVFKILWAEPTGAGVPGDATISDVRNVSKSDTKFYVGYRRFIVVATDEGHSTCVPILTYDRRGCNKPGVRASKHGIIYSYGSKATRLKNESRLGFPEVALKMHSNINEKLAKESRVNYSKLVTIEHNVKVFFIGNIVSADFKTVKYAVDQCWQSKMQA